MFVQTEGFITFARMDGKISDLTISVVFSLYMYEIKNISDFDFEKTMEFRMNKVIVSINNSDIMIYLASKYILNSVREVVRTWIVEAGKIESQSSLHCTRAITTESPVMLSYV